MCFENLGPSHKRMAHKALIQQTPTECLAVPRTASTMVALVSSLALTHSDKGETAWTHSPAHPFSSRDEHCWRNGERKEDLIS